MIDLCSKNISILYVFCIKVTRKKNTRETECESALLTASYREKKTRIFLHYLDSFGACILLLG